VATLNIALQEGFSGQQVVVRVDGEERFRADDVRTRMQIGLAQEVPVQVDPGRHAVEVVAGTVTASLEVDVPGQAHVGVSLARSQDRLETRVSDQPFGYV
jgi:hypothetical protein